MHVIDRLHHADNALTTRMTSLDNRSPYHLTQTVQWDSIGKARTIVSVMARGVCSLVRYRRHIRTIVEIEKWRSHTMTSPSKDPSVHGDERMVNRD